MNKETDKISDNAVRLCGWCSIPLDSANTVKKDVCLRCHTLLVNAGLTDKEIFAGEKIADRRHLRADQNTDDH